MSDGILSLHIDVRIPIYIVSDADKIFALSALFQAVASVLMRFRFWGGVFVNDAFGTAYRARVVPKRR
jgi:hypothetical protein